MASLLAGCATQAPATQAYLKPQSLPVLAQTQPVAVGGSVFDPGSHLSLFQDHRLWHPGDLVTIDITQNASASTNDSSALQNANSSSVSAQALLGISPTFGRINGSPLSPTFSTSDAIKTQGTGAQSASNAVTAQVSAMVTEVEPNGILALEGKTNVNVDGDVRSIAITGFARPQDIGPDNTVSSDDLANMNVQYVGVGPTQGAHHVPLLLRWLSEFWPF